MTQQHTPAPWFYGQNDAQKNYIGEDAQYQIGLSKEGWGCRQSVEGYMSLSGICREADARLIAAAPDLLEVAKMVKAWSHGLRHETAHENKMVKAAKAAIAKAQGEE